MSYENYLCFHGSMNVKWLHNFIRNGTAGFLCSLPCQGTTDMCTFWLLIYDESCVHTILCLFFKLVKLHSREEESLLITANGTTIHILGSDKGKDFLSQDEGLAIRFHKFCFGKYYLINHKTHFHMTRKSSTYELKSWNVAMHSNSTF